MELRIKILEPIDVSPAYISWFSDVHVTQYSDNQYREVTLDGQYEYVRHCLSSERVDLYGIFDEKLHIGNILIDGLNSQHGRAEITYLIGERSYWGKGVGSFAVSQIVLLAAQKYKLHKVYAGVAKENVGSVRVLEKNEFSLEGVRPRHLFYHGVFHDQLDFGLLLSP